MVSYFIKINQKENSINFLRVGEKADIMEFLKNCNFKIIKFTNNYVSLNFNNKINNNLGLYFIDYKKINDEIKLKIDEYDFYELLEVVYDL